MSRIYFHSQDGEAEVRGTERHQFAWFCGQFTWGLLETHAHEFGDTKSILRRLLPPDHYAQTDWARSAKLAFGSVDTLDLFGNKIDMFALQLNTAYSMGCDYVKLAARLHGQCEIHAYVEGPNRAWLAGIIEDGRTSGFYRSESGWEETIEILRGRDDKPVVTSYSVCEQFPNAGAAKWDYPIVNGEKDWDAWYSLPFETRWDLGITALRGENWGLELKPDNWQTFHFRDGMNANQLIARLYEFKEIDTAAASAVK